MQGLWKEWSADVAVRGVFIPSSNHDCAISKCQLRKLPLFYCVDDKLCMGPSPPTMGILYRQIVFFERGGKPACPHSHSHSRSRSRSSVPVSDISIYFCFQTGKPHFCGTYCNSSVVNQDGGIVCTMTGCVLTVRRVTNGMYGDPVSVVSYARRDVKEMTNSNLVTRAADFIGETKRMPRLEKNFESFWAHIIVYVTGMLSPQRFDHERDQIKRQTTDLYTILKQHIMSKKRPVDILQLLLIASKYRRKQGTAVSIVMNQGVTKGLAPHYASIVISLWGIMRMRVPAGEQVAKRNTFRDFIVATLELYKTGIYVRDRTDLYDIELLPSDPVLSIIGISDYAKEISLPKNISEKNITRLKNKILSSLQDAITKNNTNPEYLRICEAAEKIKELPSSVFI